MPSFDISSEVDMHEVTNAVDQCRREIAQRYDFKGSKCTVELKEKEGLILVMADDDMRLRAIQEMLRQKLAKRNVSLKSVTFEDPEKAGGDMLKQEVKVKQGLTEEETKKISKKVKDMKMKVQIQIQGDQLRVTGKKRDDLQDVISFLKKEIDYADLQFENFRD